MTFDIIFWQGMGRIEGKRKGKAQNKKQKLLFKLKDQTDTKINGSK